VNMRQLLDRWRLRHDRRVWQAVEALDAHAQALAGNDYELAAELRAWQSPDTAALMMLAERIASVLQPVSLPEDSRERVRQAVFNTSVAAQETRCEGLASKVRPHVNKKNAVVSAALVGTAVSLGSVAFLFHRRRQEAPASGAGIS